jgi:hypothetical protein
MLRSVAARNPVSSENWPRAHVEQAQVGGGGSVGICVDILVT